MEEKAADVGILGQSAFIEHACVQIIEVGCVNAVYSAWHKAAKRLH